MSTSRIHGVLSTCESGTRAATQTHKHAHTQTEETVTLECQESMEKPPDSDDKGSNISTE